MSSLGRGGGLWVPNPHTHPWPGQGQAQTHLCPECLRSWWAELWGFLRDQFSQPLPSRMAPTRSSLVAAGDEGLSSGSTGRGVSAAPGWDLQFYGGGGLWTRVGGCPARVGRPAAAPTQPPPRSQLLTCSEVVPFYPKVLHIPFPGTSCEVPNQATLHATQQSSELHSWALTSIPATTALYWPNLVRTQPGRSAPG